MKKKNMKNYPKKYLEKNDFISLETKERLIEEKLNVMARTMAIRIGKSGVTMKLAKQLEKLKINSPKICETQAVKTLAETFIYKELKMSKINWNKVKTNGFYLEQRIDHDIIYIEFQQIADIALVNVHLKNLENSAVNKIYQYVPPELMTRFKGFEKAAQLIWNDSNNSVRTNIRPGTNDFYLLVTKKGDNTPWASIKQTYTPIDMKANFEVGNLSKDDQIREDRFYSNWNIKINNRFNRIERDNDDRQRR